MIASIYEKNMKSYKSCRIQCDAQYPHSIHHTDIQTDMHSSPAGILRECIQLPAHENLEINLLDWKE